MKIRLIKEWDNAGDVYPNGQLLDLGNEHGEKLIESGFAEEYKPKVEMLITEQVEREGYVRDYITMKLEEQVME